MEVFYVTMNENAAMRFILAWDPDKVKGKFGHKLPFMLPNIQAFES